MKSQVYLIVMVTAFSVTNLIDAEPLFFAFVGAAQVYGCWLFDRAGMLIVGW